MNEVAYLAVVIHGSPGIDDDMIAKGAIHAHDSVRP
jgi:hypothetical protein